MGGGEKDDRRAGQYVEIPKPGDPLEAEVPLRESEQPKAGVSGADAGGAGQADAGGAGQADVEGSERPEPGEIKTDGTLPRPGH